MTTEEKAKAYDEALKRAKAVCDMYRNGWVDKSNLSMVDIEYVFPQLAESEDERIRKELMVFISQFAPEHLKVKYMAWLEKQKESLHITESCKENANSLTDKDERIREELIEFIQWSEDRGFTRHDFHQAKRPSEWIAYLEKQKEQKPAELSEDEKMIEKIATYLDDLGNFVMAENLRTLIYRPQPKKERQIKEGDKVSIHCRKDRKEHIKFIYDGKVGEVIDVWDAKRNPWGHIGVRLDNGCNDGFYEDELEVLDKSHWKPSEEQMNAIDYVLRYDKTGGFRDALKSLYDQLYNMYNDV